jgi:hypothetical protein
MAGMFPCAFSSISVKIKIYRVSEGRIFVFKDERKGQAHFEKIP